MSAAAVWKEAKAPDGRTYYYNTQTNATQWTKPAELEAETPVGEWKAANAPDGRTYWYNTVTKATRWDAPEAAQARPNGQAPANAPTQPSKPTFVAGGPHAAQDNFRDRNNHGREGDDFISLDVPRNNEPRERRPYGHGPDNMRSSVALPFQESESMDPKEAEATFFKALKKAGVQSSWSWEQALRAAIKDPQYHAIKNPKERKLAYGRYLEQLREQEQENEEDRKVKLRSDFTTMLKSHPDIKYFTRWRTARPIIEGETIFRSARTEEEALALFEEYRSDLYKAHLEREEADKKSALSELDHMLASLDLPAHTRWASAEAALFENNRIKSDAKFHTLTKLDYLKAFETYMKSTERTYMDEQQKLKSERFRKERQARDQYKQLLGELRKTGKITINTKWEDVQPAVNDDPRYVALLGQTGSNPLDLFWDVIEDCERALKGQKNSVLDVLEHKRFEITLKTTFDEFEQLMRDDQRTANVESDSLKAIFDRLREKIFKRSDTRHAVDKLRSRIKHLEPPVELDEDWEKVRVRLEKYEEYQDLESDELRLQAYEKFQKRLKDRERERSSAAGDRRNGHGSRRTRTPETNDPYEADRRKAQADRERNYSRKGPSTALGLSPPPSAGGRYRDDDAYYSRRRDSRDGGRRQVSSSHYDRERREREAERERSYVSRADPRDREAALDYGDETPLSAGASANPRRRRDSESESVRSGRETKRLRRDRDSRERNFSPRGANRRSRSASKAEVAAAKEEENLKSGSEEGEIEEE